MFFFHRKRVPLIQLPRVFLFSFICVKCHIECINSDNLLVETKLFHWPDEINLRCNGRMIDKSQMRGIAYYTVTCHLDRLLYRDDL